MYDIITLGSASVDVFVKSKPELIRHNNHLDLAYLLGGKILIDKLITTTGGGGTNTAVGFSRLGLKTACISCLGRDANADFILSELRKEKVDFLGDIKKGSTGYSVILSGFNDRTILTHKGVNNELEMKHVRTHLIKTNWLYISSMLGKSLFTATKIAEKVKSDNGKIALNLSFYLAKLGFSKLSRLLKITDVLILNKEEAEALSKKKEIHHALRTIAKHTKAIIVITDGSNKVIAYDLKGNYHKSIKKIKPVDTTGAGDAFGVGFVYGILKGKGIKTALDYGHREALSVLKHIGAKNNLLKKL